ncbi:hypothetical protein EXS61_00530 [Candidatus Parcubacteria bacterium]|nr:hypothetical protein [Candidatus Parcubacteria bacterium]
MSFFKEKLEQEVNLVIDFGNGSVAAALVLFKTNNAPRLIYSKRLPLAISEKVFKNKLSALALKILEETLACVAKEGLEHMRKLGLEKEKVRQTFCVLSSPWYISKTKILKIENNEPIFINRNFIDSLLKHEVDLFTKEVTERKIGALSKKDIEILEKRIIQTKLNGYNTTDPYQKNARQIELAIFLSFISKEIATSIEHIVGKYFYSKNLALFSFSLVEYSVIGDIFSNESDYVFMDISSEVTDISSVEKHVLMETTSFPFGRNHLIKQVAEELKVLPEIALSYIKMNSRGHIEEASAKSVASASARVSREWSDLFFKAFSDVAKGSTPSKIFVTVDSDVAPLFISTIKKNLSLAQKNSADFQAIPVVLLDEEKLSQFVEFDAQSDRDPFLALESIFFNKLFNE